MTQTTRFQLVEGEPTLHRLKVIGVGGCGGNAVRHIRERGLEGVDLIAANTDLQALSEVGDGVERVQLGPSITRGQGAGSQWEVGRRSAQESREELAAALEGADMVFVAAGMGGGTGTGGAPVIAEIAQASGALALAVVTTPFGFEDRRRMEIARTGIEQLRDHVDGLMVISNEKLLDTHGQLGIKALFHEGTSVLYNAVRSVTDLILHPGLVNIDFSDVRTAFSLPGAAMLMGTGIADGNDRAERAANEALRCPLLDDISFGDARGLLINISGECSGNEYETIKGIVDAAAAAGAIVKCGQVLDPDLDNALKVTLIATGIGEMAVAAQRGREPKTPDLYEVAAAVD